ncbi:MAG: DUF2911 domain-containing protein [Flavobacteriaceae bacterium]|nr:DUF2911 domain-containing protein [Flavobacteriaceae bacterium]
MKKVCFITVFFYVFISQNQLYSQRFNNIDKTPTDITYLRQNKIQEPLVKVVYGRPKKDGEEVFGEQVPYGKIWRTGANEATEVKFYEDVRFGNKVVKAGTYILHTIPGEKEWTIILNSNVDTWGTSFYDETKDVVRIKVSAKKAKELEIFSIAFKHKLKNTYMVLAWDTTRVNIPLQTCNRI